MPKEYNAKKKSFKSKKRNNKECLININVRGNTN